EYTSEQLVGYLKRINFIKGNNETELPPANLETLKELMTLHLNSIPYGNTSYFYYLEDINFEQEEPSNPNDLHTTKGVSLGPRDIYKKLIVEKRDGYCFEHNLLFYYVIGCLGYKVHTIGCRVVDQNKFRDEGVVAMGGMRHCAMIVLLDEQKYLVDVGYRAIGNFQPVPIHNDILDDDEYPEAILTDNTKLQIVRRYGPGFAHLSNVNAQPFYLVRNYVPYHTIDDKYYGTVEGKRLLWQPLFFFTIEPFLPDDIKHLNYYMVLDTTHPFSQHLILRKFIVVDSQPCLVRMFDNQIKIIHSDGKVDRLILKNEQERRDALFSYFGIDLS
ncbi:cysteine proteinase, partial [Neoconidiobolus thromboides FSU 785]